MAAEVSYEYYYGDESSQFSFYRIPRQLVTGERFKRLSTDAKLLYGLLLDRMGLSAKNGWYDEQGRVFLYYTLEEIQEDLNCGHEKAVKLLSELDTRKGFGLIKRIKQGQGRPAKIYVKRFTTREKPEPSPAAQEVSRLPIFGSTDFGKSEVKSSEKPKSRLPVSRSADFGKPDASYIKSNQTEMNQLDPSIHPSVSAEEIERIDRSDCEERVKNSIEYERLCCRFASEDADEIVALIVDTLCTTRPTVRIGGDYISAAVVKERFLRLEYEHLEYVFDCLRRNTTQVRNIRAYLLTTLYNAPVTMNHHYRAEIQHDLDG